ncbi:MAG: hypothetical protein GF341_04685 [candidate division Zixibacteria bacterium]|nr:hypothetical protein [candidate division Zixibacteria bacterium]
MRKPFSCVLATLLLSSTASADAVEQTMCFSQKLETVGNTTVGTGTFGDNVTLTDGKCGGKTLLQMNSQGWRAIQIIPGTKNSLGWVEWFGVLLEKSR